LGSLQLANGYASVETSLAIARARAQEMGNQIRNRLALYVIWRHGGR
jgi:hypothetical protein